MGFVTEYNKGILKENPTFRLVLGICPTLAVTTSVENGIGMGLAATFVLLGSNIFMRRAYDVSNDCTEHKDTYKGHEFEEESLFIVFLQK